MLFPIASAAKGAMPIGRNDIVRVDISGLHGRIVHITQLPSVCEKVWVDIHTDYGYVTCGTCAEGIDIALLKHKDYPDYVFIAYDPAVGLPKLYAEWVVLYDARSGGRDTTTKFEERR